MNAAFVVVNAAFMYANKPDDCNGGSWFRKRECCIRDREHGPSYLHFSAIVEPRLGTGSRWIFKDRVMSGLSRFVQKKSPVRYGGQGFSCS